MLRLFLKNSSARCDSAGVILLLDEAHGRVAHAACEEVVGFFAFDGTVFVGEVGGDGVVEGGSFGETLLFEEAGGLVLDFLALRDLCGEEGL